MTERAYLNYVGNKYRRTLPQTAASATAVAAGVVPEQVLGALKVIEKVETANRWGADAFLYRFTADMVRSGEPNRNGAFWQDSDLEYALDTIMFKPVNMAHIPFEVMGTLESAELVDIEDGTGKKIVVQGQLWDWVRPEDADITMMYAQEDRAFVSMECVPNRVQCLGPNGCGVEFDYLEVLDGKCCDHILKRESIRRMVDPVWRGIGIILPPNVPGWAEAHMYAS